MKKSTKSRYLLNINKNVYEDYRNLCLKTDQRISQRLRLIIEEDILFLKKILEKKDDRYI